MIPTYSNLTTAKSLRNTVLYDDQVFSWLEHFIEHTAVRARIQSDTALAKLGGRIRQIRSWRTVLAIALVLPAATFWLYRDPRFLIAGLPIIFLRMRAIRRERTCFGDLFVQIVQEDFSDEKLSRTTLYQLGEYYSQKYAFPSLVDSLVHWGTLFHYMLTFGFVLPVLLLYINFELSLLLLVCALLISRIFAKTKLYYRWFVR